MKLHVHSAELPQPREYSRHGLAFALQPDVVERVFDSPTSGKPTPRADRRELEVLELFTQEIPLRLAAEKCDSLARHATRTKLPEARSNLRDARAQLTAAKLAGLMHFADFLGIEAGYTESGSEIITEDPAMQSGLEAYYKEYRACYAGPDNQIRRDMRKQTLSPKRALREWSH